MPFCSLALNCPQTAQLIVQRCGCRDDHEIANDSWSTGAENHQPDTEGDYQDRTQNAIRAYLEWVPIRNLKSEKDSFADAFRVFQFGDLATLVRAWLLALSLSQHAWSRYVTDATPHCSKPSELVLALWTV